MLSMRWRLLFLLILNLLGIGIALLLWHVIAPGFTLDAGGIHLTNGQDFLNYWAAPQVAERSVMTLFDGVAYQKQLHMLYGGEFARLLWSYPLHSLFFYQFFAAYPYVQALTIWLITGIALYVFSFYAAVPKQQRLWMLAMLLFSPIAILEILTRQNGFFIGAAALGVLVLLERKRPIAAGILLGLLTIKPQLFILWPLMLLIEREWRCIVAAILTTIAFVGLSLMLHGLHAWETYFTVIGPQQWNLLSAAEFDSNRKLYQLMMPGVIAGLRILSLPDAVVLGTQVVTSLAVLLGSICAFRRKLDLAQKTLLLASASLLFSPYGFNYDMTLLSAGILLVLSDRTPRSPWALTMLGAGYLLPLVTIVFNLAEAPLTPLLLLALFAYVMFRHQKPIAAAASLG